MEKKVLKKTNKLLRDFVHYVMQTFNLSEFVTCIMGIIIGKANKTFHILKLHPRLLRTQWIVRHNLLFPKTILLMGEGAK